MDVLVSSFFAMLFAVIAIIEVKTGKVLLRPFVTRGSSPIWYWLEILVALTLAGVFTNSAIGAFNE
jgi:hypothetical protein